MNASDLSRTKSRVGHAVDGTNFRSDVNADGYIDVVDVSIAKSSVGTGAAVASFGFTKERRFSKPLIAPLPWHAVVPRLRDKGGNISLVLTLWQTVETHSDSAVSATCF